MKLTPARKSPLILTPRDEQMLKALYDFRYMTAEDMAYLQFSPNTVAYVRRLLARLSGGADFQTHTYLYRFPMPKVGLGRPEKIFTLGVKGRNFLQQQVGLPVNWYFRPDKPRNLGFSHLTHALLQTRVAVAASYWSRTQDNYTLIHIRLSYELARNPDLKVIPDAWLVFENQQGKKYQILLEIDRGMEFQAKFKAHVKARLAFLESGAYAEVFGIKAVIVAYVTTGQRPEYRESRRETITRWTKEVLTELDMKDFAGNFRCTSVTLDEVYQHGIYDEPIWSRPDAAQPVPLFESSN